MVIIVSTAKMVIMAMLLMVVVVRNVFVTHWVQIRAAWHAIGILVNVTVYQT